MKSVWIVSANEGAFRDHDPRPRGRFDQEDLMIERLTPAQYDGPSPWGRTGPGFLVCEDSDGNDIEVVVKLSAGCDLRETSLALELFAACVAAKLGLPVPQPYIVQFDADWLSSLPQDEWGRRANKSSVCAFGSRRLPAAYRNWIAGTPLTGAMPQTAAGILLFDALVDNPDRRTENPNCLARGDDIKIIDHELALSPVPLLGWRPPWNVGALHRMATPGAHIFVAPLARCGVDWDAIRDAWISLADGDLQAYRATVPPEWSGSLQAIDAAIDKLTNARANIDGCIAEVQRLLG